MSVVRHSIYNAIGAVAPVLVSLITVPIYLKTIGFDRYGLVAISWLLTGYFSFFDFGLGRAIVQKVAQIPPTDDQARNGLFWSGGAVCGALAIVGMLVFIPIAHFSFGLMKVPAAIRGEVDSSVPLLVMAIPLGIFYSFLVGCLEGRREFFLINAVVTIGTMLTAVLPLIAARVISPTLPWVLAASVFSRLVVTIVLCVICYRRLPVSAPRFSNRAEIGHLLRFGGWTTISHAVGPLLIFLDRFAIGAVLTSAAVAVYSIPFNLVSQMSILPAAVASAVMPRLAAAATDDAARLGNGAVEALLFFVTPMTLAILVGSGPFLHLWIGRSAAPSVPVSHLLMFGFWANSLARIPFVQLQARGRPDLLAKLHLAECLPYFLVLYAGLKMLGLPGAALAWSIRGVVDAVALFWMERPKNRLIAAIVIHAAILGTATAVQVLTPESSAFQWILFALLASGTGIYLWRNIPSSILSFLEDKILRPLFSKSKWPA